MISIVTVTYNNADGLRDTLCSLSCLNVDFELVIIDGNSSDNTIEVVDDYARGFSYKLISEPDAGIYDAMNKGVQNSSSDWVYFLNAGDRIFSSNFFNSFNNSIDRVGIAAFYGDVIYEDGQKIVSSVGPKILLHNTIHHQGVIYNRLLLLESPFNLKYRILSDYDLNLSLYLSDRKFCKIPCIAAICEKDGISRTMLDTVAHENVDILISRLGVIKGYLLGVLFKLKFRLKNV